MPNCLQFCHDYAIFGIMGIMREACSKTYSTKTKRKPCHSLTIILSHSSNQGTELEKRVRIFCYSLVSWLAVKILLCLKERWKIIFHSFISEDLFEGNKQHLADLAVTPSLVVVSRIFCCLGSVVWNPTPMQENSLRFSISIFLAIGLLIDDPTTMSDKNCSYLY